MFSRKKAHLCVKETCILMTATDCNRLQQTATDCNSLQQKEGSSLRQRALHSDEKEPNTSSDDKSATDCNRKGPAIPPTQATSLCPISLPACLSIHASIYECVFVSMRVCFTRVRIYVCIYVYVSVSMRVCVYRCFTRVSIHASNYVYVSVSMRVCVY